MQTHNFTLPEQKSYFPACPFCQSEDTVETDGRVYCRDCNGNAPTEKWKLLQDTACPLGCKAPPAQPLADRWRCKKHKDYITDIGKMVWHTKDGEYCDAGFEIVPVAKGEEDGKV